MKRFPLSRVAGPHPSRSPLGLWRVAWLLGGAALPALGGCSLLMGPQPPSTVPVAVRGARPHVGDGTRYDSLSKALGKLNSKTIRTFVERYTKEKKDGAATAGPRMVYIDVSALTRQHPAWKLAAVLEQGLANPISPQHTAISLGSSRHPLTEARPALASSPGELFRVAPQRRLGVSSPFMDATVRGRQGLDAFLNTWNQRQAQARNDDAFLARRALEDQIAASMRGTIELDPLQGVAPQTALELSNLRLRLLSNLPTSLDEREKTKARIADIEAQLLASWQAQTDAQEARLREALIEVPTRKRREGETQLASAQREREAQDRLARQQLRRALDATLADAARAPSASPLRLPLPSTRVPLAPVPSAGSPLPRTASGALFALPSLGLPPAFAPVTATTTSARISQLRALAHQEARAWAQKSAASEGALLTTASGAPNHTAAALRLMNGQTPSRRP